MITSRGWQRAGCVGVMAGILFLLVPAASGADISTRVAVVDIKKVIDSYEKGKDLDKKLEEYKASLRQKIDDKEKKTAKMTQALKFLKDPSPERTSLEGDILREKAELTAMTQESSVMVSYLFRSYVQEVYADVEKQAAVLAEREGWDLVLKMDEPGLSGENERELSLKLNMKSVLYSSRRVDVTDRLIRLMNTEYQKTKRAEKVGGAERARD